ncbi:hypothetical protein [Dongshaea marina]|uniref:hypothetical protein n=1 Tax=Dongshaea marina TaxID=2047966 RepID=UPI000D3E9FE4|nr:hypothetical protein [Dongshaea marina]
MLRLISLLLVLISASSLAAENNKLHWQGYLSGGFADTNYDNFLVNGDGGSTMLYSGGLSARWHFTPGISLTGQTIYQDTGDHNDNGLSLDYLQLDLSDNLLPNSEQTLSIGRFKSQIGLYNSTRDIPFTRPSIYLPQSIYSEGLRDFMLGMDGLKVKSDFFLDYGTLTAEAAVGKNVIDSKFNDNVLGPTYPGDWSSAINYYFDLRYQIDRWLLAANLTRSNVHYDSSNAIIESGGIHSLQSVFSLQYRERWWEFVTEYGERRMDLRGFVITNGNNYFNNDRTMQSWYAQLRFFPSNDWTLLARYDLHYNDKNDKNGDYLSRIPGGLFPTYFANSQDWTIGASWHPDDHWLIQLEHHWVDGASWLPPIGNPDPSVNTHARWRLFAVQVSYRF